MAASPTMQQLGKTDTGDRADVDPAPHTQLAASCALQSGETVPSQMRGFVRSVLAHWGIADDAEGDIRTIVSELVTNSVTHSGSPDVSLTVTLLGSTLCLSVRDSGQWCRARPDPTGEHGRGLQLVAQLATTRGTLRTPAGTHAWAQRVLTEDELLPQPSQGPAC